MPLISIIVPVYKIKEDYLKECINSLIDQTYKNIEIILVNDGTPDNGGIICDNYAEKDDRIIVIHQGNRGVSSARNRGIDAASGQWISFVDADDWIELDSLERLAKVISEVEVDLLIFDLMVNFPDKERENPFWDEDNVYLDRSDRDEMQIQLMHKDVSKYSPPFNMVGVAACKLYRMDFLRKNNMRYNESLSLSEDGVFVFEALEYSDKVFYVNEYLYHYRRHNESATLRYRENAVSDYTKGLKVIESYLEKYQKPKRFYMALYRRALINIFAITEQYYCNKNNPMGTKDKINGIKSLCESEPYASAIKEVSSIDYIKSSSSFRSIGFLLLKIRAHTMYYYLFIFKHRIRSVFQ